MPLSRSLLNMKEHKNGENSVSALKLRKETETECTVSDWRADTKV